MSVDGSLYNVNYDRTNGLNNLEPVDKLAYTRVILGPELSYRVGKLLKMKL